MLQAVAALFVLALAALGQVRDTSQWIPSGWERIAEAHGDLNGDGRPDVAMVVWPKGENELLHSRTTLRNYRLLVGFATGGRYALAVRDDRFLIPPDGMNGGPIDKDSVTIRAGKLTFSRWLLRGHEQHHFRWDGHDLRLIGYDLGFSTGECVWDTSMNFLNRRATLKSESLGETGEIRRFERRIKRGPVTLREAGADGFYPQLLMAGPDTYCVKDGERI